MLSRLRRSLRVSARRARKARQAWVRNSLDAALPMAVANWVPAWAGTMRGRAVLGALAVAVLLGWAALIRLVLL